MSQPLVAGFTGYYGMSNFGDDLFGALCAAAARRYWRAEPLLVGPRIEGVAARFTVDDPSAAQRYGSSSLAGKSGRLLSFCRGVIGSDVLVMGGGSVITGRQSFRKPLMMQAHRHRGLALAAVGVSIDPLENDLARSRVRAVLQDFSYLSLRDRRSFEVARSLDLQASIHHGRDLAGLLPLLDPAAPRLRVAGRPPRIGIAPCNYTVRAGYAAPAPEAWQDAIVQSLSSLAAQQSVEAQVFSLNEHPQHGDEALADRLRDQLVEAGVTATRWRYRSQGPLDAARAIGVCDAMVSARLHGAIVAYMQGVPFAIVDYHQKCRDFAQDVGLPAMGLVNRESAGEGTMQARLAALVDGALRPAFDHRDYAAESESIFTCAPWAADRSASA